MSDVGEVVAMMIEYGMPPLPANHPVLDGKHKRFGPGKKGWYVLREMTLSSGRTVVTGAFGFFQGENRNTVKVTVDAAAMSDEDRAEYGRQQRKAEKAEADKRETDARLAAGRARDRWNKSAAKPVVHPYLERKQIQGDSVRVSEKGELLIPMWRDAQLVGLQTIDQDGTKRYSSGMEKPGAAQLLGSFDGAEIIACGEGYATCVSARMSVGDMIDLPTAVAFDAGGIMAVAKGLRKSHPDAHLLFLADDDYLLAERFIERLREEFNVSIPVAIDGHSHLVLADDGQEVTVTAWWREDLQGIRYIEADMRRGRVARNYKYHNAGVASCHAAASAVGNASVFVPLFSDRGGQKLTDCNDLHVVEGLDKLGAQLALSILAAQQPKHASPAPLAAAAAPVDFTSSPDVAAVAIDLSAPPPPGAKQPPKGDDLPPEFAARFDETHVHEGDIPAPGQLIEPGEGGEEVASKKDKPKKIYGQAHWDQVDDVLENFILIYGEDLVWDYRQRMLMRLSAMRTVVQNSDVMKFWGGNQRKWVLKKNIVFDPRERPSPAKSGPTATVNLFSGWQMTPKKGSCIQILTLLSHLCNGVEELETWIARWIAYPLRNPGAKMETSIIMHGDEGSGKNFFFEKVVKAIYGEYGYVIGNAQLESNFNDWASMKLFMVADEVVTRAELKQMKGKLKYLVSGDTIIVNPKGLPEHSEANQMNFVFLSNELQPLALDKTDRRYLVIWTPPALGREFYVGVAQEIAAGGIEAFYHYLMHELDMGDFNEHTKPIYNKAKDALIEKSLTPAERFYREWSTGQLPLPFVTCAVPRLYAAFQIWCGRSGESKYTSLTMFSPTLQRYAGGAIKKETITYDLAEEVKQRTVFCVGVKPDDRTLKDWAEGAGNLFESAFKKYRQGEGGNVDG